MKTLQQHILFNWGTFKFKFSSTIVLAKLSGGNSQKTEKTSFTQIKVCSCISKTEISMHI